MQKALHTFAVICLMCILSTCATTQPPAVSTHSVCDIFGQYPQWQSATAHVQEHWQVPVSIQMAIVNQESQFSARARPPRTKLFWVIPWKHQTSAYGYSQALNATWRDYLHSTHQFYARRDVFNDGVDFIGWYADQAHNKLHISLNDPYHLYLAYHEGLGGYAHQSYLRKPWLINVAHNVEHIARKYEQQLSTCSQQSTAA